MTSSPPQGFLRQRNPTATPKTVPLVLPEEVIESSTRPKREEVVWGKTPGGEVFRVPATHDVLTALFHPSYPKSHFDLLNLGLLALQLLLFFYLPRSMSRPFFLCYFIFWRAAYDGGLGWVLTKQSKKKWIVREVLRRGWLDENRRPAVRNWIRAQLVGKMGQDYSFDDLPVEYNTWLLFRQAVDVILLNDFLAYCMFAFSSFRVPEGLSLPVHIMRWIGGIALIGFNLWVKTEAHNVVKDYAWYWGDVFFHQLSHLIFDGVFELAPHPMYSVGYAGYYGLSLIVGSYPVLFVSLAAHAAQFAFLVFFENPHIERRYGQRKPIAQRTPLAPSIPRTKSPAGSQTSLHSLNGNSLSFAAELLSTPAATEGETATDSDALDTEIETELDGNINDTETVFVTKSGKPKRTAASGDRDIKRSKEHGVSQHDLFNKYFRRDTVLLHNIDLFRASDFMLLLVILYSCVISLLPPLSLKASVALHFAHACAWCIFHCFGLGLLLRAQSESKFIVRHFLKNYHYPNNDQGKGAILEAFTNWKSLYNLSLCMTYTSFVGLVWKTYSIPHDWTVGNELLRHILGAILVFLHIWAAMESFEVLGAFGWFYGDFFMEDFPSHLEYSGIYRYLNNPEVMSGAAFFGLALVSGSKFVFSLAVIRYLFHWWFLRTVENPHMRKLYGDSLRKEAGFVKVIKNVASKNARILESRASRHAPELRRVAKEVKGTFDKVYDEAAEAVEEFLSKSRPTRRLSDVVQDTRVLLQQSRDRLVITLLANDVPTHDTGKYKISLVPTSPDGSLRFHLGEEIKIRWQGPYQHSRKDWIGIYRIGANKSNLVTNIPSLGMWVPVHDDEWDGDVPLGLDRPPTPEKHSKGEVTFRGDTLPWLVGRYEVRYHHDGKYNVLGLDGPFEIYVDKPSLLNFESVRKALMRIVPLCLDWDPSLIPLSCGKLEMHKPLDTDADRDPDDFSFWSERQARRICDAIKQAFDVEYVPEVVMADANLSALANRILVSIEILSD